MSCPYILASQTACNSGSKCLVPQLSDTYCANKGWLLITKLEKVYFHVYRLEEDGGLLKEGAVTLSLLVLRACSYKTKAKA